MKVTICKGPRGGVVYQLWNNEGTGFICVRKNKALPYMTVEELKAARKIEQEGNMKKIGLWKAEAKHGFVVKGKPIAGGAS